MTEKRKPDRIASQEIARLKKQLQPTVDTVVQEVTDRIYHEAYRRGWLDAMREVQREITKISMPGGPPTLGELIGGPDRVRRGEVPKAVMEILHEQDGLTYQEIHEVTVRRGQPVPLPSLRSAMSRLQRDGAVRRDGRQWYLAQKPLVDDSLLQGDEPEIEEELWDETPSEAKSDFDIDDDIPF